MYGPDSEDPNVMYYLTVYNEPFHQPAEPEGLDVEVVHLLEEDGSVLGLWPLWYLRHSFSLEPEARTLVVAGPYRLARHLFSRISAEVRQSIARAESESGTTVWC